MRKIFLVSAVMIASVVTTFCISNSSGTSKVPTLKVSNSDFSANILIAGKSDIATAD